MELRAPELVAQDGGNIRGFICVGGSQHPASHSAYAQFGKVVGRYDLCRNHARCIAGREDLEAVLQPGLLGNGRSEDGFILIHGFELAIEERGIRPHLPDAIFFEQVEILWRANRQRPKQQRVHEAEDCGVRPDAEGEQQDHGEGE